MDTEQINDMAVILDVGRDSFNGIVYRCLFILTSDEMMCLVCFWWYVSLSSLIVVGFHTFLIILLLFPSLLFSCYFPSWCAPERKVAWFLNPLKCLLFDCNTNGFDQKEVLGIESLFLSVPPAALFYPCTSSSPGVGHWSKGRKNIIIIIASSSSIIIAITIIIFRWIADRFFNNTRKVWVERKEWYESEKDS